MEIKHLDQYCERTSDAFWAEPLNAWTNMAFVIVGLLSLWWCFKTSARRSMYVFSLIIVTIGVGSFLFHTYADTLTIWADLIPIFIFVSAYLYRAVRIFLGVSRLKSYAAVGVCIASMLLIELLPKIAVLNGSLLYAPPLILLFWIGARLRAPLFLAAAGTFFISICVRTVDAAICDQFPLGSHFLWHILNSVCLGILMAYSFSREPRTQKAAVMLKNFASPP